jgi:hypothetical protein
MSVSIPEPLWDIMLDMADGDPDFVPHILVRALTDGLERLNAQMLLKGHDYRISRYRRALAKFGKAWSAWYREEVLGDLYGE